MAKVPLIVKVKKIRNANGTRFSYPPGSERYPVSFFLAWEEPAVGRPTDVDEEALASCEESLADELVALSPDRYRKVSLVEANAFGSKWLPQQVKITSESAVISVLEKVRAGITLSLSDLAAIDPKNPAPGIGETPIFDIAKHL